MRYLALAVCVFATACTADVARAPTSPTSATVESAQTQARNGDQLPFHGSLQAIETDVVVPPSLLVNGKETGTATHLGRFTATFTATVTLATASAAGSIRLVAANGDSLDATFTGHATPTTETNVVAIEEVATISGGTGRFAGATGAFTIQRVLNQSTGVSSGSFDGTINLGH
jgi:N-methylhydantoinase B/oxoprolinase/acetone carboxylase alpha subunit